MRVKQKQGDKGRDTSSTKELLMIHTIHTRASCRPAPVAPGKSKRILLANDSVRSAKYILPPP
jgi:hypothetical protein